MSDREAFEKWITVFYNNEVPRKLDDGVYIDNDIRTRWIAWKASRAQAIDEYVVPMQELFTQLDNYLSKSNSECIGSGSIFHREIQEILIAIKQLKEQP